jgi:DNA-directed RNA polymerase subunit RPC12/RpoP
VLYENYQNIELYRFPDSHYEDFNQFVVMGRKREKPVDWFQYSDQVYAFEALNPGAYRHQTPVTLRSFDDPHGRSYRLTTVHSYQATLKRAIWTRDEVKAVLSAPSQPFVPAENDSKTVAVEPLRRGHKAGVLASGAMGTMAVESGIIKSRAVPRVVVREYEEPDGTRKREETTQWDTHLIHLTDTGVEEYDGPAVLPFLEQHIEEITAELNHRMTTLTAEEPPTPEEAQLLNSLSQDRLRPDGSGEAGLYVAQMSSVVAASRALENYGVAHVVGEMGVGKSTIAAALVELDDRYPALISCPPNLIHKWKRELEAVVPDVQAKIVYDLAELQHYIAGYEPGDKLVLIVKDSTWPYGSGWEPVFNHRHTLPADDNPKTQQQLRAPYRKAWLAYEAARRQLRAAVKQGLQGEDLHALREQVANLRREALEKATAYRTCAQCGKPVDPQDDFYATRVSYCPHCDAPLFQWERDRYGNAKMPFDIYVRDQAPDFFKLFIVDEVHRMKGQTTTRGEGFGRMSHVIGDTLTLTGTFFGGVASSIFYLLLRSTPQLLADGWDADDQRRWIATYGRLQKTYRSNSGSSSLNARDWVQQNVKELAGISPTVFKYIFPTMIFRTMADLGVVLPDFNDEIVRLKMTDKQASDYRYVKNWTWSLVQEYGTPAVANWFQWILSRPNSAFRDETVRYKKTGQSTDVEAVINPDEALLPKEQWLVEHCQAELAKGRRVLVYIRQTGTRNIRPRIEQLLRDVGIEAVQLPDSVSTDKREAWLLENQPDVLIVNPRRVAVGLDLVMYQDAVFYEIEYSLAVLWQAVRRVWRLGQHREVNAHYLVYTGTMEEAGLAWIGKKKAAAQRMMGSSLAGALVDDSEDYGLMPALMAAMEAGGLLADDNSQDASLFTNTTQAMNQQAADVAGRITDSEYYDEAEGAEPDTHIEVAGDTGTDVEADARDTRSITRQPADVFVSSVVLSDATQPSFWDTVVDDDDDYKPEPVLVNAEAMVQASLPGM